MAVDPEGHRALSGGADGSVCLWAIEGEALRPVAEARLAGAVAGVVLGAGEGAWVLDDRGEVSGLGPAGAPVSLARHEGGALALALDAGAGVLTTGGVDGVVRLWGESSGEAIGRLTGHEGPVAALVSAGGRAWSAGWDGTLRAWDLEARRAAGLWRLSGRELSALAWGAEGRRVLCGGHDGSLWLWRDAGGGSADVTALAPRPHGEWVRSLALSGDGRRGVAAAPGEGEVLFLDLAGAPAVHRCPQASPPSVLAFHPDGRRVVVGRFDGSLEVVEPEGEDAEGDARAR
ncbi:MAG: hypothetical protein HY722_13390 [Planctomycetes bacterium]|nr:hypothetical protein [Planctomycetota bacterium]